MNDRNDLTGHFGCWKIINRAEGIIEEAGDTRTAWNIRCEVCGYEFIEKSRNIKRRRNFPVNCKNCRPKKDKNSEKIHYSKLACSSRSFYGANITDNKKDVTCQNCLKLVGFLNEHNF